MVIVVVIVIVLVIVIVIIIVNIKIVLTVMVIVMVIVIIIVTVIVIVIVSEKLQLRFASKLDRFLYFIGAVVAIATGCGMPLMSIIVGDLSQAFVEAQVLYNHGEPFVLLYLLVCFINQPTFHQSLKSLFGFRRRYAHFRKEKATIQAFKLTFN